MDYLMSVLLFKTEDIQSLKNDTKKYIEYKCLNIYNLNRMKKDLNLNIEVIPILMIAYHAINFGISSELTLFKLVEIAKEHSNFYFKISPFFKEFVNIPFIEEKIITMKIFFIEYHYMITIYRPNSYEYFFYLIETEKIITSKIKQMNEEIQLELLIKYEYI